MKGFMLLAGDKRKLIPIATESEHSSVPKVTFPTGFRRTHTLIERFVPDAFWLPS